MGLKWVNFRIIKNICQENVIEIRQHVLGKHFLLFENCFLDKKRELQHFGILGYLSIKFTISILKFMVVLLILNSVTAFTRLLFSLHFLKIIPWW